jgi:hypothetical protein
MWTNKVEDRARDNILTREIPRSSSSDSQLHLDRHTAALSRQGEI